MSSQKIETKALKIPTAAGSGARRKEKWKIFMNQRSERRKTTENKTNKCNQVPPPQAGL